MRQRFARTAIAALLLASTACSTDDPPAAEPTRGTTPSQSPTPSATETTAEQTSPTTSDTTAAVSLDWQPTGHSAEQRVIVGERWVGVVAGARIRFEPTTGEADDVALPAVPSTEVNAVLLEGDTAIVSYAYGGETTAGRGYRVDLTTGKRVEIVTPEPANGGDWALVEDSLYYLGLGEDKQACLATLAVSDGNGEEGWCPPGRTGITELEANLDGVTAMLFDYDSDIACRTLTLLDQAGVPQPVEGPTECIGWDIAATGTGVIFSEVPKPKRQEAAVFRAVVDGATQELGPGTTGTLISCGGDAFFVSDPATMSEPARLMRWDGSALSVAYESTSKGNAFLGEPECADGILTLSSFGEDGDEQVSASVS